MARITRTLEAAITRPRPERRPRARTAPTESPGRTVKKAGVATTAFIVAAAIATVTVASVNASAGQAAVDQSSSSTPATPTTTATPTGEPHEELIGNATGGGWRPGKQ